MFRNMRINITFVVLLMIRKFQMYIGKSMEVNLKGY